MVGLSGVMMMSPLHVPTGFACPSSEVMERFPMCRVTFVIGDMAELDGVVTYEAELIFRSRQNN